MRVRCERGIQRRAELCPARPAVAYAACTLEAETIAFTTFHAKHLSIKATAAICAARRIVS